jgi:hypothetical protein
MKLIIKDAFYFHPKYKEIIHKMGLALTYFPEIETIKIGIHGRCGGSGCIANANYSDLSVNFNLHYLPSYNTIFHELGHILQFKKKAPNGEEAASIFGLSRMPIEMVESNFIPYIGLAPADMIPSYCQAAIGERVNGRKQYIKWLFEKLKNDEQACHSWPNASNYNPLIEDIEFFVDGKYIFARGFETIPSQTKLLAGV